MYKNILVAIDGSETGDRALQEAVGLASLLNSILCILYVAKIPFNVPLGFSYNSEQEYIKQQGLMLLEKARSSLDIKNLTVITKLVEVKEVFKSSAVAIKEYSNEWPADLLIMGTHGRSGLNRLMLGSVAEETIRIIDIPILLVRTPGYE